MLSGVAGHVLRPLHPSFDVPGGVLAMTLLGHERAVSAPAWTADGEQLLSVGADQMLRVWTREGLALHVLTLPTDVRTVAVDAGSRRALCGSGSGRLVEVDLHSGGTITTFYDDPRRAVDAVAISCDGRRAATSGRGSAIHVWDVRGLALANRHGLLVSCSMDRSVRAWRLEDASPVGSLTGDSPMHVLALSPDESIVAVGDQQGRVHLLGLDACRPSGAADIAAR